MRRVSRLWRCPLIRPLQSPDSTCHVLSSNCVSTAPSVRVFRSFYRILPSRRVLPALGVPCRHWTNIARESITSLTAARRLAFSGSEREEAVREEFCATSSGISKYRLARAGDSNLHTASSTRSQFYFYRPEMGLSSSRVRFRDSASSPPDELLKLPLSPRTRTAGGVIHPARSAIRASSELSGQRQQFPASPSPGR